MALLDEIHSALPDTGSFGVYARHLGTGETVEIDAGAAKSTASAAKTFILVHYAQLVAKGDLDPQTRVPFEKDDHVLGSGVMRYLGPGLAPTLDDLAWLMTIVSDNVATNMLLRETGGPGAVNAAMDALDLPNACIHSPITFAATGTTLEFATSTPRDLAEIYTRLDDRCREILYRQQFLESLPRRLPHLHYAIDFGVKMPLRVYNKTGSYPGVCTDAGLFETDDAAWIAAVMGAELPGITAGSEDLGPRTIADVGEILYKAWGSSAR